MLAAIRWMLILFWSEKLVCLNKLGLFLAFIQKEKSDQKSSAGVEQTDIFIKHMQGRSFFI